MLKTFGFFVTFMSFAVSQPALSAVTYSFETTDPAKVLIKTDFTVPDYLDRNQDGTYAGQATYSIAFASAEIVSTSRRQFRFRLYDRTTDTNKVYREFNSDCITFSISGCTGFNNDALYIGYTGEGLGRNYVYTYIRKNDQNQEIEREVFYTDQRLRLDSPLAYGNYYTTTQDASFYYQSITNAIRATFKATFGLDNVLYGMFDSEPNKPVTNVFATADVDVREVRGRELAASLNGQFSISGAPDQVPSAVPEPSSWGMMIVGFLLVGCTLRKARSSAKPLLFRLS